ncbi:MAG: hypothetical protein M3O28_10055 [Actinomycetota bacterium]|nr:hypothetical protein [Actinomycetota bacterium]
MSTHLGTTVSTDTPTVAGIEELADAVLFEGYMLYPYRANDPKNRVRWQFGVLAPPGFVALDPSERAYLQTDCLLEGRDVEVTVRVRFLHVQQRTVECADGDGWAEVDALDVGDATFLPWDEAVVHEAGSSYLLAGGGAAHYATPVHAPASSEAEILHTPDGVIAGRLARARHSLDAELTVEAEPLPGPYGTRRLRVRLENTTAWTPPALLEQPSRSPDGGPERPDALRHALVAAHLIVSVRAGAFVSLIDPPEWAKGYAEGCEQVGAFPVLAGPPGDHSLVLASPIILYDHPQVAPESVSQFCDATEMDEMLTLRTLTLTEEEKRFVRGSDARGAALVHDVDNLPPELMDRLHGAIRSMTAVARPAGTPILAPAVPLPAPDQIAPWMNAEVDASFDPETDVVMVAGIPVSRGASVRLRPGGRRADAQDMFLEGRLATVEAVLSDLDGAQHVAVSLDDLVEDGFNPHGRYLYFSPEELEPMGADA